MTTLDQRAQAAAESVLRFENDPGLSSKSPIEQRPRDQAPLQQDLAELSTPVLLGGERSVDLDFCHDAGLDEQCSERVGVLRRALPWLVSA
jgi:hypothetical protein